MRFEKKYNDRINLNLVNKISKEKNLDINFVKLLFMRGLNSENKIYKFLNPSDKLFYNPYLLFNMRQIVEKINMHIENNSRIVILGDYDTDGISASAIVYNYLLSRNIKANVFLPNRVADGYGLSLDTVDKINNLYNPELIITVDCGISAYDEVDYCKKLGIDIIVTDHHDIPEKIPNCLVLNPKIEGQKYPFKELCGAGVAFKLVQGLAGINEAKKYLPIATLATVADIVPLIDENRAIVYFGLKDQDNFPIGIKHLIKKIKLTMPISSSDISYKLAPKINASGRMGDALVGFNLYVEKDVQKINKLIDELLDLNDKRLSETNNIVTDVSKMLTNINVSSLGALVLVNENWESGVLGIICSKIADIYNRPVCVMTKVDNDYKGSLRSIPSIDIYDALNNCKDLLIQFGGHNQAAGITIAKENIEKFNQRLNEYILSKHNKDEFIFIKKYDMELQNNLISQDFVKQLNLLEPFGLNNEKPIFKISFNNISVNRMSNYPNHIKANVNNLELIGFNFGHYYYNLSSNCNKEALVELNIETFAGKTKIKGLIKHLNFYELNTGVKQDIINGNYITQLALIGEPKKDNSHIIVIPEKDFSTKVDNILSNSSFGNLIIANTFDSYKSFIKQNNKITNFEMYSINNNSGENTLLFAPIFTNTYSNFKNIILLDPPVDIGYVNKIAQDNCNIYLLENEFNFSVLKNVSTDRKNFAIYHNAIKDSVSKNFVECDMLTYFEKLKKVNPQNKSLSYNQFLFVLMVLSELKIITVDNNQSITFTNNKSDLHNSKIYNFIDLLLKSKE